MATQMPPAGKSYQLAHINQSLSSNIIGVSVALPIVATIAVILRLIARRLKRAEWKADDLVVIAALLATYALCTELVLCAGFGIGHHLLYILKNPQTANLTNARKMQYAIEMTWNICTYLVKLSNILLLARLFAHPSTPYFRVCLHIVHAFLLFWTTASFFSALFRCTPVNSFWDLNVQGSCPHIRAGRLIPAVLNSFTDVVLLSLPMRPVWQLQLPWRQKIAVLGMFCVGFLALAASATRLHYSVAVSGYHGHDPTYVNARPVLWAIVEPCTGIVCACLPLLRPLFIDMHTSKMSGWLSNSFLSKFSRKEADTWWHPPLEESDREGCNMSDLRGIGKRANSDWSFISSHKYKIDVKEEVVSMTELREAGRSVEIAARAFDRFSCNLEGQAGLII